ncbi:MAG: amino acid--tRNA ligase-related protein [Candidatus Shikimatogenerans sp. AspAUS03]|uniref:Lysyl-tRNA synthetase n=1 Tax=Candidatus Shikimatogenerans sp. AspAUS03 TaxID=3158563 RepID=A0AAU7QT45_9FLAO
MLDQEKIKKNKIIIIKNKKINIYPSKNFFITNNIQIIKNNFLNNKKVYLIGRIINIKNINKLYFLYIKDFFDNIQLFINLNNNKIKKKTNYLFVNNLLDVGDIIYICGILFKTLKNIITVKILNLKILIKCFKVLTFSKINNKGIVYYKFTNLEKRYRYRYIDLLINEEIKKKFIIRFNMCKYIRSFLNNKKFIEIETPILNTIYGGADASPFKTYYKYIKKKIYLRIANEIYLKKMLVGGFNRIYEFSKNFRNESIDKLHNPEFTMLELYVTYKNYIWMMNFCKNMLLYISIKLNNKKYIVYNKQKIYFDKSFIIKSFYEIINNRLNLKIENLSYKELLNLLKKLNIKIKKKKKYLIGNLLLKIFEIKCQKYCIQPTIIYNYPKDISPLTKSLKKNINLVQRFELFIAGYEIANAYTELNDPIEQKKRFFNNKNIDYDFLNSLKIGMPPSTGIGIGIDRLSMLFTNSLNIQDIISFPQMK